MEGGRKRKKRKPSQAKPSQAKPDQARLGIVNNFDLGTQQTEAGRSPSSTEKPFHGPNKKPAVTGCSGTHLKSQHSRSRRISEFEVSPVYTVEFQASQGDMDENWKNFKRTTENGGSELEMLGVQWSVDVPGKTLAAVAQIPELLVRVQALRQHRSIVKNGHFLLTYREVAVNPQQYKPGSSSLKLYKEGDSEEQECIRIK
ncbi:hypothetical protein STEG23_016714 [Scotinomys teguina]